MSKHVKDLVVTAVEKLRDDYAVIHLHDPAATLPEILPGQFVEVRVDHSPSTFLRRPISINEVDINKNEFCLLLLPVVRLGQGLDRGTAHRQPLPL